MKCEHPSTTSVAIVALALGVSWAHALKAQDGMDITRVATGASARQILDSAAQRSMARSISVWMEEEEKGKSEDGMFGEFFKRFFTVDNVTEAINETLVEVVKGHKTRSNRPRQQRASLRDGPKQKETIRSRLEINKRGMENLARKVLNQQGMRVVDEDTFHEVLRYYDGECAKQSLQKLKAELIRAQNEYECHNAWTARKGAPATPFRQARYLSQVESHGTLGVGVAAPLNQAGYRRVAKTGKNGEMADFVRRVLEVMDLEILNDWGLRHFVPYHSGDCSTQNFVRLVDQLYRAVDSPSTCGGGWLAPRKKGSLLA